MSFVDFKDGVTFTATSTNTPAFTLLGGQYGFSVNATWGGGSVDLQMLMPDGSSYQSVLTTAFTANGTALLSLPRGTYRVVVATATAVQGAVVPVPYRQAV